MAALSIQLPNRLARDSQDLSKALGITRTQFIRIAIKHELERVKRQIEIKKMSDSFTAMKQDSDYLKETLDLDGDYDELTKEQSEWWKS